jgi:hypothetical protein
MAAAKILPYLRAMKRPGGNDKMLERISKWRTVCPLTLRSTFPVGLPGETEEDFELLLDWLQDAKSTAPEYEPVRGAAATDLGLPPPGGEGENRQALGGHRRSSRTRAAQGRTTGDAPEIDGKVHIVSRRPLRQGDIVSSGSMPAISMEPPSRAPRIRIGVARMGWYVRYIDDELKHEMLSRELATEDEALEEAWQLAQGDNEVVAIDGPDDESVPMEEIEAWFENRSATGETEPSS